MRPANYRASLVAWQAWKPTSQAFAKVETPSLFYIAAATAAAAAETVTKVRVRVSNYVDWPIIRLIEGGYVRRPAI